MRTQYQLSQSAYAKRAEAISQIPNFWPLVLEQAPLDVDQFIQSSDSRIFSESLLRLEVTRPEIEKGSATATGNSPRSLRIKFTFTPNDDFEDTELEKTLWYRRASDGWTGLVSEPVPIRWKKSKDLTEGLVDGAVALWKARKKTDDMMNRSLPEYTALRKKVEHLNGSNTSFFTWFGWVSGRRWVSAEESERANKEHQARKEARKQGEKVQTLEPDEDDNDEDGAGANDDSEVEVHEAGEDLAISFAEDVWPNAIKFFTQAMEMEEMSEADFEDDDDLDDEEDIEFGDGQPIDIRSLVQDRTRKRTNDGDGPSKKKKK